MLSSEFEYSDSREFYRDLKMFEKQSVPDFDSYLFPTPKDQCIIAGAFPNGESAFVAFIDEIFLNVTDKPISAENIIININANINVNANINGAIRKEKERVMEKEEKEWMECEVEQKTFGDLSNERFFGDEVIQEGPTRGEILGKIGFKRAEWFAEGPTSKDRAAVEETRRGSSDRSEIECDEYCSEDGGTAASASPSATPSAFPYATPSASESEGDFQHVTLEGREAEEIIEELGLPADSWGSDVHSFIIAALARKSKGMEPYIPFDPTKEVTGLHSDFYAWANSSMSKHIDVCQIRDGHRLVLRISDWANDNFPLVHYEFQALEHLIASVCQQARGHITGMYKQGGC